MKSRSPSLAGGGAWGHVRTSNLLQQMMRLRSIRTLDVRHETMVDSAFFGCVPRGKYKQFKEAKACACQGGDRAGRTFAEIYTSGCSNFHFF